MTANNIIYEHQILIPPHHPRNLLLTVSLTTHIPWHRISSLVMSSVESLECVSILKTKYDFVPHPSPSL